MRRIKRVDNYFTLEAAARVAETDLLCDQCGDEACPIRAILKRLHTNRMNAELAVIRCDEFVPKLVFRDPFGLGSTFNTFRLGGAWASRVRVGDRVSLRDKRDDQIGVAEVIGVIAGPYNELVDKYAVDNHLSIDAELRGVPFNLTAVMYECYGKHRFTTKSTVTVIELRRVDGTGKEG